MPTREEFLKQLWTEVIDTCLRGDWIAYQITEAERKPDKAFADAGLALKRVIGLGADPCDLGRIARAVAYEAVFSTLYMLGDPGVDEDDVLMLHESLLSADPSGLEGRPRPAS